MNVIPILGKFKTCVKLIPTYSSASLSTTATRSNTKKLPILLDKSTALLNENEKKQMQILKEGHIVTEEPMDVSLISGVPEEHIKGRTVRIFPYAKNSMQSGTHNVGDWSIEFDTRERWENPLMGWSSTGDPLSNMKINFLSETEAIEFCEKNGWKWFVDKEHKINARGKAYSANYSWNKRSRVSTK